MRKLAMLLAALLALLALGAGSVLAQEGDAGSEVEGAKVATDKAGQTIQCMGGYPARTPAARIWSSSGRA